LITKEKQNISKESQENNGIHMTERVALEGEEVMHQKAAMEKETGEKLKM